MMTEYDFMSVVMYPDLTDKDSQKELDVKINMAIKDKLDFRHQFAQKISITRLNYMYCVLRAMYPGKATISDPDAFKDKIRQLERIER